jgi:hypothetical protein
VTVTNRSPLPLRGQDGGHAQRVEALFEEGDGLLEGPAAVAGAVAVGAVGLAIEAGEELRRAVELGGGLGGELNFSDSH